MKSANLRTFKLVSCCWQRASAEAVITGQACGKVSALVAHRCCCVSRCRMWYGMLSRSMCKVTNFMSWCVAGSPACSVLYLVCGPKPGGVSWVAKTITGEPVLLRPFKAVARCSACHPDGICCQPCTIEVYCLSRNRQQQLKCVIWQDLSSIGREKASQSCPNACRGRGRSDLTV